MEKIEYGDSEKLDRTTLKKVAEIFMSSPEITDVEVYGSLSRQEKGNDIDIILITTQEKEALFYNRMKEILNLPVEERNFHVLADELFKDGSQLLQQAETLTGKRVNILVHASDWRERVTQLQENSFHRNPHFLENISKDAISVSSL